MSVDSENEEYTRSPQPAYWDDEDTDLVLDQLDDEEVEDEEGSAQDNRLTVDYAMVQGADLPAQVSPEITSEEGEGESAKENTKRSPSRDPPHTRSDPIDGGSPALVGGDLGAASTSLLVRHISYETKPWEVQSFFETVTEVKDVYLPTDYDTGRPRGFGFVEFFTVENAQTALDSLNHQELNGKEILISFAQHGRKTPILMRTRRGGGRGRVRDRRRPNDDRNGDSTRYGNTEARVHRDFRKDSRKQYNRDPKYDQRPSDAGNRSEDRSRDQESSARERVGDGFSDCERSSMHDEASRQRSKSRNIRETSSYYSSSRDHRASPYDDTNRMASPDRINERDRDCEDQRSRFTDLDRPRNHNRGNGRPRKDYIDNDRVRRDDNHGERNRSDMAPDRRPEMNQAERRRDFARSHDSREPPRPRDLGRPKGEYRDRGRTQGFSRTGNSGRLHGPNRRGESYRAPPPREFSNTNDDAGMKITNES